MSRAHSVRHHGYDPQSKRCPSGKRRFDTQPQAEEARTEQELLTPDLRLDIYHCLEPGCGGWHLTRTKTPSNKQGV